MDEKTTVMTASKKFRVNSEFLLAMLALLIAIAITIAALFYARNIDFFLKTVSSNNQLLHRQMQQLQSIQSGLLDRINQQQQQLAKNQELETGNHKAWILAEVNYLVQLATYNLNYSRDLPAAIALLQTADKRVAQLNDPDLTPMRQQLANNIAGLQAVGKIDVVGILAKLTALQLQVKQLPLIAPPAFSIKKENTVAAQTQNNWQKMVDKSLMTLKSLVIIRHHQKPVEPLLDAEQLLYLQQNLQLQLQQAQWAVLHGQKSLYQNSLQQVINSVQGYFASASPQTTAFIQNIQQLQKIDIQPALPDMTALLNALAQADRPATVQANGDE